MGASFRSAARYWKLIAVSCFSLSIALALGIIALSVSNTALLLPPSAPDADRLVTIYEHAPEEAIAQVSYPDYQYFREHNHVFTDIAGAPNSVGLNENIDDSGRHTKAVTRPVSENYFEVMGLHPFLGRFFSAGADRRDEAVITWQCWKRLGADLHIVGKQLFGHTVVAVAPREFTGGFYGVNGDIFTSLHERDDSWFTDRQRHGLVLTARLKPGVTREQAQAEMTALSGQLASAYPNDDKGRTAVVTRATLLPPDALPDMLWATAALVALVLMVLLIACANVANLLLAAAVGRRREAAIKLAIGAQRGRLIGEFLAESLALCAVSGAVGYAIAAVIAARFSNFSYSFPMWGTFSFGIDLRLDGAVLGLTIALIAIASLATGLAPALYASSPNLSQMIGGEVGTGGIGRHKRRNALVVVQVAVCTLTLAVMGLCQRNLYNLRHADLGFSARSIIAANAFLRAEGYDEVKGRQFYDKLRQTIAAVPGVASVTLADNLPLLDSEMVDVETPGSAKPTRIGHAVVDGAYFSTIGLPLAAGRSFDASDREGGQLTTVVNRKMADMFWPGQNAIGKTVTAEKPARRFVVVGVAANSKYDDIDEAPKPFLYYALSQNYSPTINLMARTGGDPNLWIAPVRKAMAALGLHIMANPFTFESWMNFDLFGERMAATGAGILSGLALLLSAIGLAGAISYSVSERKRELGIRVALGARSGQLLAMVLRQTATVTGAGIAIGCALGVTASIALQSAFYRIGAVEWTVLVPVAAGMMALSLAIAYISARPWLRADPMDAVRHV